MFQLRALFRRPFVYFKDRIRTSIATDRLFVRLTRLLIRRLHDRFPARIVRCGKDQRAIRRFQLRNFLCLARRDLSNTCLAIRAGKDLVYVLDANIKDRSGGRITTIQFPSFIIYRRYVIRRLRRSIRGIKVDLFSFVR